jgi:hypothetical protein
VRQGRDYYPKAVDPTEQVRIAAQIRQAAYLRKIRLQIGKEAMDNGAKVSV